MNIVKPDTKICDTISRLRTRSRLREIANRRRQASKNNNGEHTLLDQDIVTYNRGTPTNAISETHPLETTRNIVTNNTADKDTTIKGYNSRDVNGDNNEGACGGDASKRPTLGQGKPDGNNPSSAITLSIPSKRNEIKNTQRRKTWRDLITIYKSEDETEHEEDPVDTWALRQHLAGNRDPRFTSASRAERRFMMENGMWLLHCHLDIWGA